MQNFVNFNLNWHVAIQPNNKKKIKKINKNKKGDEENEKKKHSKIIHKFVQKKKKQVGTHDETEHTGCWRVCYG